MYHAPLKDMRFVFRHLIDQSALATPMIMMH